MFTGVVSSSEWCATFIYPTHNSQGGSWGVWWPFRDLGFIVDTAERRVVLVQCSALCCKSQIFFLNISLGPQSFHNLYQGLWVLKHNHKQVQPLLRSHPPYRFMMASTHTHRLTYRYCITKCIGEAIRSPIMAVDMRGMVISAHAQTCLTSTQPWQSLSHFLRSFSPSLFDSFPPLDWILPL